MTTKKLVKPDIIEAMIELDFIVTENKFGIQFMNREEKTCYVTYYGSTIECWAYNDEHEHQRYQLILMAELRTFPSLSEWMMLMHVGQIIALPKVIKLLFAEENINLFEAMNVLAEKEVNDFKQLINA
jgi:hypothetical protein